MDSQPTRGDTSAWELGGEITTPYLKKPAFYEMLMHSIRFDGLL